MTALLRLEEVFEYKLPNIYTHSRFGYSVYAFAIGCRLFCSCHFGYFLGRASIRSMEIDQQMTALGASYFAAAAAAAAVEYIIS